MAQKVVNSNKIINVPTFYRDVMVHFGSKEALARKLGRYVDKEIVEKSIQGIDFTGAGCTYTNQEDGVFIVWMPTKPETPKDTGFLVHELFHVVTEMFRIIGVNFSEDSEEAYAYTLGYLTQKVIEKFGISISCHAQ